MTTKPLKYVLLVVGVIGLGCNDPGDSGATNTSDIAQPGACDALRTCCQSVTDLQQSACTVGAPSDEMKCTLDLETMRADGLCP